jgi:hypothetical protein
MLLSLDDLSLLEGSESQFLLLFIFFKFFLDFLGFLLFLSSFLFIGLILSKLICGLLFGDCDGMSLFCELLIGEFLHLG